jgi:hypothetical protein
MPPWTKTENMPLYLHWACPGHRRCFLSQLGHLASHLNHGTPHPRHQHVLVVMCGQCRGPRVRGGRYSNAWMVMWLKAASRFLGFCTSAGDIAGLEVNFQALGHLFRYSKGIKITRPTINGSSHACPVLEKTDLSFRSRRGGKYPIETKL